MWLAVYADHEFLNLFFFRFCPPPSPFTVTQLPLAATVEEEEGEEEQLREDSRADAVAEHHHQLLFHHHHEAAASAPTEEEEEQAEEEMREAEVVMEVVVVVMAEVVVVVGGQAKIPAEDEVEARRKWEEVRLLSLVGAVLGFFSPCSASEILSFFFVFLPLFLTNIFRCVLASLKEGVTVRPSVRPSVRHTRVEFLRNGLILSKIASGT